MLKKELLNYFPDFLIGEWDEPTPNDVRFTIDKSTFFKDMVYHIRMMDRIKGSYVVIWRNGLPLTHFKVNIYNPRWEDLVAFRINNILNWQH